MSFTSTPSGSPLPSLAETGELKSRMVCALSGLRPAAESPRTVKEWFLAGTEPGKPAAQYFDEGQIVLPETYASWCRSESNFLGATTRTNPELLEIVNPKDGSTFSIDNDLPATQQALVFKTALSETIQWKVNGKAISGPWMLQAGSWQVTAEASDGRQATSVITVE